jgi:basic membrane lipoprotein Med (substrate-binding protein (PBP1-ABC) superfamily)
VSGLVDVEQDGAAGDTSDDSQVTSLAFMAGWMDMPTQIVSDEEPFSMLWGLITFGGGKLVTQAQGFVQGPEFWSTVRMVAGFVFGVKSVSNGARLF